MIVGIVPAALPVPVFVRPWLTDPFAIEPPLMPIAVFQRHDSAVGITAAPRGFDRELDRTPSGYAARAVRQQGRPLEPPGPGEAQLGKLAGIDARANGLGERRRIEKGRAHKTASLDKKA